MDDLDIIGPNDEPALVAVTTPEVIAVVKPALQEIGYKVHMAENFDQFETRYSQINYHVVVIEEFFAGSDSLTNPSLQMVQELPMSLRRHAVFILIGQTMETLNALQAFSASVHCTINYAELSMFPDLVRKTVVENDLFLSTYRDTQRRVYQKA